ncbi:hypothetical protein [Pseudomonas fragi]|jgi:hypothetical protein|uniref:hypothetical protein n=1 Tax=Pseudomonas fragi TaxID=296 RepID=UPI00111C6AAC|nr:hypothetical protein [Pseudomonas fragi]MDE4514664.1 hypothetical protein [Pseudomonas fragi]NNB04030.1 hypothetical protein [Pseudomonas fragi]NNB31054.1 hypothetical protein [Pseudomonas fragi]NNB56369.1 hypothetical protein [Pseudomonas fragi]QPC36955.1 hypothetical protein IS178_07105 [Pseudomonas fragi]
MDKKMNDCNWEVIEEFSSPKEYERFVAWITGQVKAGMVEQTPVQENYAGPGFEEKWFKCIVSSETWRLISPQDPFHGYWGPV